MLLLGLILYFAALPELDERQAICATLVVCALAVRSALIARANESSQDRNQHHT